MSEYYGKELDWRTESWSCDENGAVTLEIVKPWDGALLDAGDNNFVPQVPTPPSIPGYSRGGASWKLLRNGGRVVAYTFKGVDQGMAAGTNGEPVVRWRMSPGLYQRFIKTLPWWDEIKVMYGWDDDKKEFPDKMPSFIPSSFSSPWLGNLPEKPNPLRGVTSYDDGAGTITQTFISPTPHGNRLYKLNEIVKRPWQALGNLGGLLNDRDWKAMLPAIEPHGPQWRISQTLEMSGEGGWNTDVYRQKK